MTNGSQFMPFNSSRLPPGGHKWSKVKEILIPQHSKARTAKHKPNSSHNALELANLDSLPQRSASILNGNYGAQTHMHAQHLDCSNEMQKTKTEEGGVLQKYGKKMRFSEGKNVEEMKKTKKKREI